MLPAALIRAAGSRLAEGIVTHQERQPVDVELARSQHRGYVEALRRSGFRTVEVEPADDHPDGVFVEDTLVVFPDDAGAVAVLTRPGAPERRGEVDGTAATLDRLVSEFSGSGTGRRALRTMTIEPPGTLDGGDVLRVGDTVYVGRSARTNSTGIDQLTRLANDCGYRVVPVELRGTLHLKSAVTALPDGALIGLPQYLPDAARLPAIREPAEAAGAHLVPLDDRSFLIAASAPRTAEALAKDGWEPITVDISEFEKLEGCVTCLSVLLP